MTTPFVPGRPTRPEDLSAFYPEWTAPASGIEAERRSVDERRAEQARIRQQQARAELVRRATRLWTALRQEARLRLMTVLGARAGR